jgi:hypothetical protein
MPMRDRYRRMLPDPMSHNPDMKQPVNGTSRGVPITDNDTCVADEAEAGYASPNSARAAVGHASPARPKWYRFASPPSLRAAVQARAAADPITTSDVTREALRPVRGGGTNERDRGRKKDGRDGKRTGSTSHSRSLPVTNGHSNRGLSWPHVL